MEAFESVEASVEALPWELTAFCFRGSLYIFHGSFHGCFHRFRESFQGSDGSFHGSYGRFHGSGGSFHGSFHKLPCKKQVEQETDHSEPGSTCKRFRYVCGLKQSPKSSIPSGYRYVLMIQYNSWFTRCKRHATVTCHDGGYYRPLKSSRVVSCLYTYMFSTLSPRNEDRSVTSSHKLSPSTLMACSIGYASVYNISLRCRGCKEDH